jgi:hypothetical protein
MDDKGTISSERYPESGTFGFAARKDADPTVRHYTVVRESNDGPWRLLKAWRTDEKGKTTEEYFVP